MPLGAGFGGDELRFPLPFAGPSMQFASIPAVGTALHPHLRISTKAPEGVPCGGGCPEIPTNTVREYTVFAHNSAFGDVFSLNIPELGGGATGRSHLAGRVLIQFGERSRDSVPVTMSTIVPGGMLARPPDSPMAAAFPGRLTLGLLGHDEVLHFPQAAYSMHGVCFVDDPFEFSIGSVDLKTGRLLGPLLYRGFIVQDVLLALMALEPRTPKSSFYFRGPAAFARDATGQTVFGFSGTVRVPYPEGFRFPRPDLQSVFEVGPGSALDPYVYMQAMEGLPPRPGGKSGGERGVAASNGQRFSYTYDIAGYPAGRPASFEYVNETTGGTFRMGSLGVGQLHQRPPGLRPGRVRRHNVHGDRTLEPGHAAAAPGDSRDLDGPGSPVREHPDRRRPGLEHEHEAGAASEFGSGLRAARLKAQGSGGSGQRGAGESGHEDAARSAAVTRIDGREY